MSKLPSPNMFQTHAKYLQVSRTLQQSSRHHWRTPNHMCAGQQDRPSRRLVFDHSAEFCWSWFGLTVKYPARPLSCVGGDRGAGPVSVKAVGLAAFRTPSRHRRSWKISSRLAGYAIHEHRIMLPDSCMLSLQPCRGCITSTLPMTSRWFVQEELSGLTVRHQQGLDRPSSIRADRVCGVHLYKRCESTLFLAFLSFTLPPRPSLTADHCSVD